jgi:vanillate O-demethylase ferredoxin subunit
MSDIEVKVLSKRQEAEDIVSFELARADGGHLPGFSAGAHVDVHAPGGIIRQYSLCNDASEQHRYRIAVLRDPSSRGGSIAMHDAVHEGDTIRISAPRNHFPLVHSGKTILFAGGIGVTPLLCMAHRLHSINSEFEMHYCSRSPERTAFAEEVSTTGFQQRVHFHFDSGATEQRLNIDEVLDGPKEDVQIYVCGPAGFIDYVTSSAKRLGWPAAQVHLEYFGAAPQDAPGDKAFKVTIASTGATYDVPAEKSVAQALQEQGIEILMSCEQGVCGTCITRVLAGQCDHRDLFFSEEEKLANDQFTPCCSRAKSDVLVLDL